MKSAVSAALFGAIILAGHQSLAEDRDYTISGTCNGVATSGIISFRDVGESTLVRERLVMPDAPRPVWSDRIGLISNWSETMTDQPHVLLTDPAEMSPQEPRTYALSDKNMDVTGGDCQLSGKSRGSFGMMPMDVTVSAATTGDGKGRWTSGYKPSGPVEEELRFQFDRFGAVAIHVNVAKGLACIGETLVQVEREISPTQALIKFDVLAINDDPNCFADTGLGAAVLNKGKLKVTKFLPGTLRLGDTGETSRLTAALNADYQGTATAGGAPASGPWPAAITLQGGLDDIPLDTAGVSLTMSVSEIQRTIGGKIIPTDWTFFNRAGLEPPRLEREDLFRLSVTKREGGKSRETLDVSLSQWHTGNRPIMISRRVDYEPDARPSEETFKNAVMKKYGEDARHDLVQVRGSSLLWTYDQGAASKDCKQFEVPSDLRKAYGRGNSRKFERILDQIDNSGGCDGELAIYYATDAAKRIEYYTVKIVDTRALVADSLNGRRVDQQMKDYFMKDAQSGNDNEPDL